MHLTDEQRADGWIEHDGGPCPVAKMIPLTVALLHPNGEVCFPMKNDLPALAGQYHWEIDSSLPGAIIAYRLETPDAQ